MSHWVTYTTDALRDAKADLLDKALGDEGLGLKDKRTTIKNSWGEEIVDMVVTKNNENLTLGFAVNTDDDGHTNLELKGDFYLTGISQRNFMNTLAKNYQKHKTVEVLEMNGYVVDSIELNEDNEVEVVAVMF